MLMVAAALFGVGLQFSYPPYAVRPLTGATIQGLPAITSHICVDQFGYLPDAVKVAVIADPVKGYNAFDHYTPGQRLEVRTRAGRPVFTGGTVSWHDGAVHEASGDRGWWFDFSVVSKPGQYYVYDAFDAFALGAV